MHLFLQKKPLLSFFCVAILIQFACSLSADTGDNDQVSAEMAATQVAIQATQAALEAQAAQPSATLPSDPTATSEPEPSATPEPQPTAEPTEEEVVINPGDVLWWTDFDNDDPDNPDWTIYSFMLTDSGSAVSGGRYASDILGSKLYLRADSTYTYLYAIYEGAYFEEPFHDVIVEARVEKVGGPNTNNIQLVCRASEAGWYEFIITSGGLWEAYRFDAISMDWDFLGNGGNNAINTQFQANDLALACIGDQLTFYANGTQIAQFRDSRFSEGFVGVGIGALDVPDPEIEIDWLTVTWPGP